MSEQAFNSEQIDELGALLRTWQQELQVHLQHSDAAAAPVALDQQSVGRVSRIDAIQQQQMACANQELSALNLKQVQLALQRIESGDYGFCQDCGEAIAFARLQAQPIARLCLSCQSASEST